MTNTLTVESTEYGLPEKLVDGLCGVSRTLGLPWTNLSLESIERRASALTGAADFGNPHWRNGMQRYILACQNNELSNLSHAILRVVAIKALKHRVEMMRYVERHPEVRDVEVKAPIFVLGFPRTGTTALQNLLTLDPANRGLAFWELTHPFPECADPEADRAQRIKNTERFLWFAYRLAPEQDKIHEIRSDTTEECWPLFIPTGHVLNWDLGTGFEEYGDYLLQTDMVPTYQEYKLMLQILQHQRPSERLVLKCPEHLWFLDALLEVFPDACIAWTHRDPLKSIASYCSLISMQWRTFRGRVDPRDVGTHISRRFLQGVERAMQTRDRVGEDRFYDVNFHSFVHDQAHTVRQLKRYFGISHPAGADDAIESWLSGDRLDKRGAHKYSIERFGIDPEDIYGRYASYIERFAIKTSLRAA